VGRGVNGIAAITLGLSGLLMACGHSGLHPSRTPQYAGQDVSDRMLTLLPLYQVEADPAVSAADTQAIRLRIAQDFCRSILDFVEGVRVRCESGSLDSAVRDTAIVLDDILGRNVYNSSGLTIQHGPRRVFRHIPFSWFEERGTRPDFALLISDVKITRLLEKPGETGLDLTYQVWDYRAGKVMLYGNESWSGKPDAQGGFRRLTDHLTVAMILGTPFEGERARSLWFPFR
jgi:hypothetical protein